MKSQEINLYNDRNILNIHFCMKNFPFIIFFNINKLKKEYLLYFKNEVSKLDSRNFVINSIYIKKLFNFIDFRFLGSNTLIIALKDFNDFINVAKLLNNNLFFYSIYRKMGNYIEGKDLINFYENYQNNIIFLHYIISRLIFKIAILILLLLYSIIKYLK